MLLPLSCGLRCFRRCLVCYALCSSRPPLDESPWASRRFCGSLQRLSQAGCFATLQRPRRSNHKMVLCVPRGAGERIKASELDHPSSLRRATYVALFKVAYLRISLVFRITLGKIICFHGVRGSRSSVGRFQGRPPLWRPSPDFALGAGICGEVLLF
jgi:hypothetical protein